MKKLIIFLLAAALLQTTVSCGQVKKELSVPIADGTVIVTDENSIPTNVPADITGRVTRISRTTDATELLVENDIYSVSGASAQLYKKAVIRLDEKTAVGSGDKEGITASSLSPGMMVDVWFSSDPNTDSTPVLVYALAVKVLGDEVNDDVLGFTNLPQMTIGSGSTYLSVVTFVSWDGETQKNAPFAELIENNIGARVGASSGDQLTLGFTMQPDSFTVARSDSPDSPMVTDAIVDGSKIVVPGVHGQLYYRVDAYFGDIFVEYAFVVDIME